ncbi:MAG: hypothetical protein KKA65_03955 [Nanoarchaeota archaeon]|nr:hypothetical protein [Nanoarchaeota archaeon]MBU4351590.1 hypothetical protein [Nanoarchaeota archaeon]MBU4456631.1 hypothetical protein [Nanoarchaeota archaeon]
MKKLKEIISGSIFGLALATVPISGCGQEGIETIGGLYPSTYEVTRDEKDIIPMKDEIGEMEIPVITLNKDESYIRLGLFEWHDFERKDGLIEDVWTDLLGFNTFDIKGNIADGNLSLDACYEFIDLFSGEKFSACWNIQGFKQMEYLPQE